MKSAAGSSRMKGAGPTGVFQPSKGAKNMPGRIEGVATLGSATSLSDAARRAKGPVAERPCREVGAPSRSGCLSDRWGVDAVPSVVFTDSYGTRSTV